MSNDLQRTSAGMAYGFGGCLGIAAGALVLGLVLVVLGFGALFGGLSGLIQSVQATPTPVPSACSSGYHFVSGAPDPSKPCYPNVAAP